MAVIVSCPCGNLLDCDQLELVVSLTCPSCKRELALEVETEQQTSSFAVLTVMEGPCWVGEQFIMPVGQDLCIGRGAGNWLSLDSTALSDHHCRLRVSENGRVTIEDLQSRTGTWIGSQRIAQGRLAPMQSFTVGGIRFRLDLQSPDGTTAAALAPPTTKSAEPRSLPTLGRIKQDNTFEGWLTANRFLVSRWGVFIYGWLSGAFHAAQLSRPPEPTLNWPAALLTGAVIITVFTAFGRRVALAHPYFKYVCLGALVVVALLDISWGLPASAIASLIFAGSLFVFVISTNFSALTALASVLGCCSILLMAVVTIAGLVNLMQSF